MTPTEIDVPHALVRVLEEAGIEFVFGMPGGDTGRIFDALYDSSAVRTILVRHEQTGSVMAEMYGRVTGKPGVVMGQGIFLACNALFGPLEAVKGASPMLVLGDFTDMAPFKTLGDKRYIRLLFQRPNQLWIGDYHGSVAALGPRPRALRHPPPLRV